ncbi:MAG: histidine triad nucleotide-binding protein [Xanthomonadaceae bacterium]|nr:histidine triad nucleotide-binding protein [Xanthomonadaceae bacterium]
MSACIFCKILKKEIPSQILFENENVFAIRDIQPQSKEHVLIIPKKHYSTLHEAESYGELENLSKFWLSAALEVSKQLKIDFSGYRLVINQGENGGQTVFHLHLHLLGGERLSGKFV